MVHFNHSRKKLYDDAGIAKYETPVMIYKIRRYQSETAAINSNCITTVITSKLNYFIIVNLTSPCSLNRSTTIGKNMVLYLALHLIRKHINSDIWS